MISKRRLLRPLRLLACGLCFLIAQQQHAVAQRAGETSGLPQVVAHRGLLLHAPENTLSNFRACISMRIGFEFDVARSKDGHLVCMHDDTVDRTTDGTGSVADLTLEELRKLDAGGWFDRRFAGEVVPTVEEIFVLLAQHRGIDVLVAVDLKAAGVEAEVVRLAAQHRVLDRLLFIGRTIVDSEVRDRIRGASDAAQTAVVANSPDEFASAVTTENATWVYFRYLPSPEQTATVKKAGKRSFIAGTTVGGNLPGNWMKAREAQIDAILTDYALELAAELRKPN
jgi:glycerophosphoryl diester phosphodiesterase